ncbi:MAG: Tll0287-like domain-containing protein [Candidatus Deferrimicrobiaceae bacterium]
MASTGGEMTGRIRDLLVVVGALFVIGIGLSLQQNIAQVREDRYQLAVSTGNVLFRTIVATRSWNSSHGGVYVPVTDTIRPNPYLTGPDRDVRTTDGRELTLINPAYMTRLVGEILAREGYTVHLTSLKTLRPGNAPDEWEREALGRFEKGSALEYALTGPAGNRVFRYMEPLKAEEACLPCHAEQRYKVGDVRGGIGIAFPYAPFERSIRAAERLAIAMHAIFLTAALAILFFLGFRIMKLGGSLEESQRKVRTLEGIMPICANCKKIRKEGAAPADQKSWVPVDSYITDHSGAIFSHGICPECAKALYGWSEKETPPDA